MESPYRSEVESLRAENVRLRAELASRRRARPGLAVALVALEVSAIAIFRPWLNGSSDAKFWTGLFVVLGVAIAAAFSALGYKGHVGGA